MGIHLDWICLYPTLGIIGIVWSWWGRFEEYKELGR